MVRHSMDRDLWSHIDACGLLGVVEVVMTIHERRDYWMAERRLIKMHLAQEPHLPKGMLDAFKNDASTAEQFIRYYEARIAREASSPPLRAAPLS